MLNRETGTVRCLDIDASMGGGDCEIWRAQGDASKYISDSSFINAPNSHDEPARAVMAACSGRMNGYGHRTLIDRRIATAVRNNHD